MKKWISMLLVAMLVMSMCMACTPTQPQEPQAPADTEAPAEPAQEPAEAPAEEPEAPAEAGFEGDTPLAEPVKVKMSGLLNANLAGWYTALEKGYFLKRGIELEFLTVASGNEAATALASGDVDFAFASLNNLQAAIASGNDQSVVIGVNTGNGGDEWYCSHMALVVHPDSEIKEGGDVSQLKGAVIGTQLGGTSELYAKEYLKDIGLDPETDVQWVNINNADQLTAFINGEVDIISSSEPYNTQFQIEVPGAWELVRGGSYFTYASAAITTKAYYEAHPDIVLRVMAALAEGLWSTRMDTAEAAEILSHWMPGSDVALNAESMKHVGYDPRLTVYTEDAWDYGLQSQIASGKLTAEIPMADYCDATFINAVVENHPEWFEDLNDAELLTYAVMGK